MSQENIPHRTTTITCDTEEVAELVSTLAAIRLDVCSSKCPKVKQEGQKEWKHDKTCIKVGQWIDFLRNVEDGFSTVVLPAMESNLFIVKISPSDKWAFQILKGVKSGDEEALRSKIENWLSDPAQRFIVLDERVKLVKE